MQTFLKALHYISYSKFVFLAIALGYIYYPLFDSSANKIELIGTGLIYLGIGLSMDALRDQSVVDKYSKKLYQKPVFVITFVITLLVIFFGVLGLGIYMLSATDNESVKSLIVGLICACLGGISIVRQIIETSRKIQAGEL